MVVRCEIVRKYMGMGEAGGGGSEGTSVCSVVRCEC
jgi:hypothetical protein